MTLPNLGRFSNLAARLGHNENTRLLIVNCDDLGSSQQRPLHRVRGRDQRDHDGPMPLGTGGGLHVQGPFLLACT